MKKYNRIVYYYDSFSIAVINPNGKIRRLYCPFLVNCIHSIGHIEENSSVYVEQVLNDPDDLITYLIGGKIYAYSNFRILINF